jgi:hypothetical protein
MPDLGLGDHVEHAIGHPQAGAEHGHDRDQVGLAWRGVRLEEACSESARFREIVQQLKNDTTR